MVDRWVVELAVLMVDLWVVLMVDRLVFPTVAWLADLTEILLVDWWESEMVERLAYGTVGL